MFPEIEPAGAFDDYTGRHAEKLRKKYPAARTGRRVVTGWDIKVSRAIKSLNDCLNTVRDALHPSPEAEYFEPLSLKVVEHIEGAANLLAQYGRERETAELPEWSKPIGKKDLRPALGISYNTLKGLLVEGPRPTSGKIRYQAPRPAARKILVALSDLPKAAQDKLRAYIR